MASSSKRTVSSSNLKDDFSDHGSEDKTYEMNVESSDDDSVLSGSVDLEKEETPNVEHDNDDPFLYALCEPHRLVNNIDDNEAVSVNEQVEKLDDNDDVEHAYRIHNPKLKWKPMKPSLGEKYENPAQLKYCVTNYAIANGYQLRFYRNDSKRLIVWCGSKDVENPCPFRLYASWMNKERTFQVKILDENHTCARDYAHNPLPKPTWIAQALLPNLIKNSEMTLKEMKQHIFEKYLCKVSIGQCYRAKLRAIHQIEGSLAEHYGRVWDYGGEIIRSNPGSTVKIYVDESDNVNYFRGFYVCFKALKEGWKLGCRPVIGLDGCFLKSICQGQLLTAIGRDANNQVYPIAWAVFDIENKQNWTHFITLLTKDLELSKGAGLTLISDQHKGLIEAVKDILPHAEHRQCARHVYANFKKKFNGLYKRLFWGAAMSTVSEEFERHMLQLKEVSEVAYNHLMERNPASWCRAFFEPDRTCEAIENGICESFNKMILDARKKPVITLLESIRLLIMQRIHVMSNMADQLETDVCPAILKRLKLFSIDYRSWSVIPSGGHLFETRQGKDSFSVDIEKEACSCNLWQLSGIPCVHGIAAIISIHRKPEDFVSHWFRKGNFVAAYSISINPMHGSKMWAKSPYLKPLPPKERRMPGRPVLKRKKHASEMEDNPSQRKKDITVDGKGSRSMTCGKCLGKGHNKRKCDNDAVEPPEKVPKPRGRSKLNISVPSTSRGVSRGRRRGGGSRSKFPKSVGVSYENGETMIHHVNGEVTPAWPAWVLPKAVQDALDAEAAEVQKANEEHVDEQDPNPVDEEHADVQLADEEPVIEQYPGPVEEDPNLVRRRKPSERIKKKMKTKYDKNGGGSTSEKAIQLE